MNFQWLDQLILTKTGDDLTSLQKIIVEQVVQGYTYREIADAYGYTEGHIKDVGSQLWRLLSQVLEQRITKRNCRTILSQYESSLPQLSAKKIPNFIGREAAILHLNTLINQGSKVIVIQGEGGLGKTTLAQQYFKNQKFEIILELLMAKEKQYITSAEQVVEEWLKQDFQQEPSQDFGIALSRLKRQLNHRYIGILIDNFETALDEKGCLISSHRNYVELLRILGDANVKSVTLITTRDRLCEPDLNLEHYRLPQLSIEAWQAFFESQVNLDISTLTQIHWAYGGNAKAMRIICGLINEDFAGNMIAYWQKNQQNLLVTTALKNLVIKQINRLQSLDSLAYRLLIRLSCYRYQNIANISIKGIFYLLWDVSDEQYFTVIRSLRNRSLLEFEQGQYWLHPVIQAEAMARLRHSEDWEMANGQAALFWTNSVEKIETIQDALQGLEAYYHYLAIEDFEQAGSIILKSRNNQWGQFLPLGSTLYRLGLLQPVFRAINQVIPHLKSEDKLSELYNILGDLYWITGKIHQAIACQEQTITLATKALQKLPCPTRDSKPIYYFKMLNIDALLSIGLYKIDLWELEEATLLFEKVIRDACQTKHHAWAQKASICLGLVKSYLGEVDQAHGLANEAYDIIFDKVQGKLAYFLQILGQTYVNLQEFERGHQILSDALRYAQDSHYVQVEAKTLNGLAEIARQQQCFETALDKQSQAIQLLEEIGATCDLAEAHWQLSLTYQAMNNLSKSKHHYQLALQLFTKMQAPKQVEKILKGK
ncbi:tetratricopeptide repeat protein [Crocosphaera subtropica]|nr:tetratricopeptide repeat protein [Crocosphaera subtropica]